MVAMMDPLWDDLAPAEPKPKGDPDCVACDAFKWYSEARRWRDLWWQADTEAKVYVWLLCQMADTIRAMTERDEAAEARLALRHYWLDNGYGLPERGAA